MERLRWPRPGSRDGGSHRSCHDEQRAQRRCKQRWQAAQQAGGRIRTGDPSVKPPAPATASKTGRARPPQRPQRPLDLFINLHDGFCHLLSIVVGFVKMGKLRSADRENTTRNEPKRRELSRVLARNSRGSCGARLRRRAGSPVALAVVGWWQAPWSSAMRMARLWRGRSTDESTDESTTDEVHWTQVPAPPRGHAHVVAYLPHQCLQSRRNPIRNPISGSLHHIA